MINTNCDVEPTHNALSITPAAGFNRDRASTRASSDNMSTDCSRRGGVHGPDFGYLKRPLARVVVLDT